jgi:predicted small secreted protein
MTKAALSLIAVLLLAAACNTMKGMGEDVQDAGGAITDSASDAEDQM